MKKNILLLFSISVYFLVSCSPSQKVLNSWINTEELKDKKYNKIFVAVITENKAAREVVESDLAATIKELGYSAIKSIDVITPRFGSDNKPSNEEILGKIRDANCDLILTVTLLDSKSETRYVPEEVGYRPYPRYTYYRGFSYYYTYWAPTVYKPGYYTTDNSYFFETNLFDAVTENILWSVQSVSYNPSNLIEFSKEYCRTLVFQAKEDGLLK